jgi:hypothetical protein
MSSRTRKSEQRLAILKRENSWESSVSRFTATWFLRHSSGITGKHKATGSRGDIEGEINNSALALVSLTRR